MPSSTSPDVSPTVETFSTPPTTPRMPRDHDLRASLSRRSSRPSMLTLEHSQQDWNSGVVLDDQSPGIKPNTAVNGSGGAGAKRTAAIDDREQPVTRPQLAPPMRDHLESLPSPSPHQTQAMKSPCFVHSHLDKGASLSEWLRAKQKHAIFESHTDYPDRLNGQPGTNSHAMGNNSSVPSPTGSANDEDEYGGSLTRQLAETVVGVREMSKQLGRARVRSNIQNVLIITKARDNRLIKLTRELALYLMLKQRPGHSRGLVVYVDNQLRHSRRFDADGIEHDYPQLFVPLHRRRSSSNNSLSSMSSNSTSYKDEFTIREEGQLRYWTSDMCSKSPHLFDFVVTLGGDGTVLFTSWLFQRIVPPVLPFALGSLGFLTNFDFADHQSVMDSVIDSGIRVNLRMRFTCTVYRAVVSESGKGRKAVKKAETGEIMMKNVEKGGWEALESGWSGGHNSSHEGGKSGRDKEIMCFSTRPVETFEVMNDLVVDRGPSPYVSLLELFGDEHHMTTVQADGLIVSTPTGSTAYSLSAGGSLVHPEIPSILISPICPHTLSFRPMLLPDSMELRICVPFNSRSTAWASFDGRGRVELKQGDHIKVTASRYPFPTVCADNQSTDWFHAISRTLKWNERERQKSFVVVEEGPESSKKHRKSAKSSTASSPKSTPATVEEDTLEDEEEDEVSDEEDDKFDIDDSSPEAAIGGPNLSPKDVAVGKEKTQENVNAKAAADALSEGNAFMRAVKSRSRSRSSGLRSGVDSPDRFAGPHPHPPSLHPRHAEYTVQLSPDSEASQAPSPVSTNHRGNIHSPRYGRRSARDRETFEDVKTPTVSANHRAHHEPQPHHRAFAVWGQDESDSNASDSDA